MPIARFGRWIAIGGETAGSLSKVSRTGLLCWREPPPRRRFRKTPESSDGLVIASDGIRWKRNGLWYQVETRKLERNIKGSETPDFVWHGEHYAVVKKHQLNSCELREAGLTNDA